MEITLPASFCFVGKNNPEGISVDPGALFAHARAVANTLKVQGVAPGDRVALWLSSGIDQVAAALGCWMVGAAFCILPSFAGRSGSDRAVERVQDVMSVLKPRLAIQSSADPLPSIVTEILATLTLDGQDSIPPGNDEAAPPLGDRDPDDLAFIQFTSGSTGGMAKGAEVRFGQLLANLDALARRIGMTQDDRMVSWAPLYHDMGLMAVLLSLRTGADLVLIETEHFVRRPSAWLENLTQYKGTVTTGPPTALKLLTRRRAKDVDLSSLRYAWIGGEAVFPVVLQAFEDCYADAGLRKGVMQPTYGMAETVVGISCGHQEAPWVEKNGIISCGAVLDNMEVRIANDDGAPVDPGQEGRILTRGPSVISGYLGLPRFDKGGWLDTGDLGFMSDGLLFVSGRIKDVIKRGAESFPAALVETIAEDALDLRTGRTAVFATLRPDLGKEEIVLLVEARGLETEQARQVAGAVMKELGLQIDVIRAVKGGRLPRTSSGKLMRPHTAALYRDGDL